MLGNLCNLHVFIICNELFHVIFKKWHIHSYQLHDANVSSDLAAIASSESITGCRNVEYVYFYTQFNSWCMIIHIYNEFEAILCVLQACKIGTGSSGPNTSVQTPPAQEIKILDNSAKLEDTGLFQFLFTILHVSYVCILLFSCSIFVFLFLPCVMDSHTHTC